MASSSTSRGTKLALAALGVAVSIGSYRLMVVGNTSVIGTSVTNAFQFQNQEPAVTGTGTTSTVRTFERWAKKSLTATGGVVSYNTLTYSNPTSFTGAILEFCLDIATAATPSTSVDCGVVSDSATGTGVDLFNNELLTRGVHCANVASTTEVLFGPDERIKCGALTGSGQNVSAKMHVRYREAQL